MCHWIVPVWSSVFVVLSPFIFLGVVTSKAWVATQPCHPLVWAKTGRSIYYQNVEVCWGDVLQRVLDGTKPSLCCDRQEAKTLRNTQNKHTTWTRRNAKVVFLFCHNLSKHNSLNTGWLDHIAVKSTSSIPDILTEYLLYILHGIYLPFQSNLIQPNLI